MTSPRHPFRLNVGFVLHQEVGYKHEFSFDFPIITLEDDLELRQLAGGVDVGRTAQGLLFTGRFAAQTALTCVRCLQPFDHKLAWSITEMYASTQKSISDSELIVPEDSQIDLEPILREYALLEVPIKPICRPDCKGLCPTCGQDLNLIDCGHRPGMESSPFAALEDFLKQ
jgi:uncharacterized protein